MRIYLTWKEGKTVHEKQYVFGARAILIKAEVKPIRSRVWN
jgi:hypothetical protein